MRRNIVVCSLLSSVFLIVASIFGGQRTEWKTYVNERWGYSIGYPADWAAKVTLENIGKPEKVVKQRVTFTAPSGEQVYVDVWVNESGLSLKDWIEANQKPVMDCSLGIPKESNGIIAGSPAFRLIEADSAQVLGRLFAILQHNNKVYRITWIRPNEAASKETYEKMVGSFKLR
ncbi:MAG: PsbP-related protein [Candidatus Aureabacteria bacterium]|nr:PsbP-related protein [Candidatus Auribacterota bacterium]